MIKLFEKIDKIIESLSGFLLVIFVCSMLALSVTNIFLRWVDLTLYWVEPLVRHLVLFSAFLGGVIATGRKNHIGIDVVGRWLESNGKYKLLKFFEKVILLVSIFTLAWLSISSVSFMEKELEFGREVFWGIHSGVLVGIIPLGFSLIGFRVLNLFVRSFGSSDKNNVEKG